MSGQISNGVVHKAGAISFIGITLARSIQFISSLWMIAYLSPEEIGEFAFAMFVMLAVFSCLTTGTDSRIIAMEDSKNYLPESWTIELLRGALVCLVMAGTYGYSLFSATPSPAYSYMLLLGVAMFVRCARNINMVISRKKLDMIPIFFIELGSAISMLAGSVIWVMIYKNGWALAVGYFLGSITYTLLSFTLLPNHGCEIKFNLIKVREIFGYSKWIFCTAQIVSFFENIIPLFVSQMFGIKTLGLFEKSDLYSRKILGQINQIFWIVGLPWASARSRQGARAYQLISLILLPFVLFAISTLIVISIFIPQLLAIVGGASWSASAEIVRALCVVSATACLNMPFGIVMQAIKLPMISFIASVTKLLAFFIIFGVSDYENVVDLIYSLAWANLISTCFYFVVLFFKVHKGISVLLRDVLVLSAPFVVFHLYCYDWITQFNSISSGIFVVMFCLVSCAVSFGFSSVRDLASASLWKTYRSLKNREVNRQEPS